VRPFFRVIVKASRGNVLEGDARYKKKLTVTIADRAEHYRDAEIVYT